ncbi:MAG: SGNH/GDSL hydrolase family protein [Daejeonella sp.]
MKIFKIFCTLLIMSIPTFLSAQDWANLNRYREENLKLNTSDSTQTRIVFFGNSITEGWPKLSPAFFQNETYINRGIGGQTTPQFLVRFRADVINLKPKVVLILGGTNDIAGNTGPSTLEMIADNLFSMAEIAKANDIQVVLCSVLPVFDYSWKPGLEPANKIIQLNKMIKNYADSHGIVYLDYFTATVDERNGMKKIYSEDGVHPNAAGYKVMEPLAQKAIAEALKKKD